MTSVISQESCQDWDFLGLGGVFSVEWIQKESLPFHCTQHILNPWNDNKKVQISRDGQVRACFLFSGERLLPSCFLPTARSESIQLLSWAALLSPGLCWCS